VTPASIENSRAGIRRFLNMEGSSGSELLESF
jgi:hypothetical protein